MRSFLRLSQRHELVSGASTTCLLASCRSLFVRETMTPVTVQPADASVAPFPARLLWQFRSSTPRHLSLCVRGPARRTAPASPSGGPAVGDAKGAGSPEPHQPEDYVYGRLFLRPYNVAQLLTVLQGWSDTPATVERPRSSLHLAAVAPKGASVNAVVPTAVQLTARFTRKVIPRRGGPGHGSAVAQAAASPTTDVDPEAAEDYPDSVYVEGEMGTFTTVLRNEDLVLLTTHLESVLSDFFTLEHHAMQAETRRVMDLVGRHREHSSAHQPTGQQRRSSHAHGRTSRVGDDARPRYRSHMYRSSSLAAPAAVHAAAAPKADMDLDDLFDAGSEVDDVAEGAEVASHTPPPSAAAATTTASQAAPAAAPAAPAAAAPSDAEVAAGEDEYEEVVEEVEEDEVDDQPHPGTVAASPLTATADHSDAATSSTAYIAAHTRDSGTMTVESDSRYATGRFVRDGSLAASEVAEVRRVGDFDVVRRTQQAQGSTEADGARTTVSASHTAGAFRSTAGNVTGTFSYERVSTATASSSAAAASAALAATTAMPVHHADKPKSASTQEVEEGETVSPIVEVVATSMKDVEAENGGEEEAEEEADTAATAAAAKSVSAKPKSKRASSSGGSKRKSGKAKLKKASKRTSASKAAKAAAKAEPMSF